MACDLICGDIANDQGDLHFSARFTIAGGETPVLVDQAIRALLHGWRWVGTYDDMIIITRGPIRRWSKGESISAIPVFN